MDKCVCCGSEIVEGVQVCYECNTIPVEELTKAELTQAVMKLTKELTRVEEQQDKIYNMFLSLLGRVSRIQ